MTPAAFRQRARHEALRYGSDPWIFVRELLQNARDAGAHRVALSTALVDGLAQLTCEDDGAGMTFEHARRYLFALYASSKEGDRAAAGRFGVGFWSILRFDPTRIVVRSWPSSGDAWQVELDGALTRLDARTPPHRRGTGTEIQLERAQGDGDLARRVRDAAWQSARFLQRLDDPQRGIDVRVNGEAVTVPFDLPAPSASFRKGRLRGVVALGREARVELFAKGLRVRAASAVEDLLSADGSSALTRVRFPTLADGVAPQAILDGDDVEPLLARADARNTAGLRRLVALAQDELRRLIESQIDAVRPSTRWVRHRRWLIALVSIAAVLAGLWLAPSWLPRRAALPLRVALSDSSDAADPEIAAPTAAYRDFRLRYQGPRVELGGGPRTPLALHYEPPTRQLYFAALLLEHPLAPPPLPGDAGRYEGPTCGAACVSIDLRIDDGPGWLRVPVPTGFRVDPASVSVDGRRIPLRTSAAGEALLALDAPVRATLRYRVQPAADRDWLPSHAPSTPELLADAVQQIRLRPAAERIEAATAWVRARIAYSASAATVERHRLAAAGGRDVLTSALEIGAADCDVQNAVLTTLLQLVDVPARLAVGYVGVHGVAVAPAHAWVEVRDGDRWRVADASRMPARAVESDVIVAADPGHEAVPALAAPAGHVTLALDSRTLGWFAAGFAAAAGIFTIGLLVTRTRRELRVAPRGDLAGLLRGALERPDAFRHVPALYQRPLIPQIDGRSLSLADVSRLARDRRLFRSANRSPLARRAAAEGAAVVDTASREGRATADALGAVDLDEWETFLQGARRTPLLDAVEARLRLLGEPWHLRAAPGLGSPAVLDLVASHATTRLVVLDADAPWLAGAEALRIRSPAEAMFVVVDRLAEATRLTPEDRRRVLPPLAREALREAAAAGRR
jgi:hypothetical protein